MCTIPVALCPSITNDNDKFVLCLFTKNCYSLFHSAFCWMECDDLAFIEFLINPFIQFNAEILFNSIPLKERESLHNNYVSTIAAYFRDRYYYNFTQNLRPRITNYDVLVLHALSIRSRKLKQKVPCLDWE